MYLTNSHRKSAERLWREPCLLVAEEITEDVSRREGTALARSGVLLGHRC